MINNKEKGVELKEGGIFMLDWRVDIIFLKIIDFNFLLLFV